MTMQVISQTTNGVSVENLVKTIQAVKGNPEIARFRFNVSNRWIGGGHNRSQVEGFRGALEDHRHAQTFTMDAGEPPVLLGNDEGANPVEYLMHALASCVTTSMVYHAAAQGIEVQEVESTIAGDLDLRGFLGLDPQIRKGFQAIRMSMRIRTNADEKQWNQLVNLGPTFSPVFDSVTKGVPVQVTAERMES
jgi:uncharacterized OsmC-like protein